MTIVIDRIEKLRIGRGLEQQEVESLAALGKGRYSKWKNGTGEPTARQALRIARLFGVPVEWLADDDAPEDPPVAVPLLSPDEERIIDVVRSLELSRKDAIRRLAGVGVSVDLQKAKGRPSA